ncbi:MAG: serine hydrolase [bacterium]|nr:serine hydrolase [bacterium]
MSPRSILIIVALVAIATSFELLRLDEETEKVAQREREAIGLAFRELSIEGKAVYVYDVAEGRELYSKNGELPLPLASLVKLMTGLVAVEESPNALTIKIGRGALMKEGDTGLLAEERWDLARLVAFTLTTSSNDGAEALAVALTPYLKDGEGNPSTFSEAMNEKAESLSMSSMYFSGSTGLDENGAVGGYGSAKDVALLLAYLLEKHPALLEPTAYEATSFASADALHNAENTNKRVASIPGLIASKTGFTDLAGGNLAIAFERGPGHPIVIVVLGSSQEGRFDDVDKLVRRAIELGGRP